VKAIRYDRYGSPDVLQLRDVDVPPVGENDVLIRVHAAAINPLEWHYMRGEPYVVRLQLGLRRPKLGNLGGELAGTVEKVGAKVTRFTPGDEVFGGRTRIMGEHDAALAEYATMKETAMLVPKPANATFEQAAAVPVGGLTALQTLRDRAKLQKGQKVLVNGASGGTGTFVVQVAKALGAEVTAVCSTDKIELVRSLGADEVIDYTKADFTTTNNKYDVLIDNAANRPLRDTLKVLAPKGTHVGVGLASKGLWLGPALRPLALTIRNLTTGRHLAQYLGNNSTEDLTTLANLITTGKLTPAIDRTYPLAETSDAIRYLETGHAKAKVIITM
jgi:NADPH:quinone reductase-like Zn-dependent oxidoreductase